MDAFVTWKDFGRTPAFHHCYLALVSSVRSCSVSGVGLWCGAEVGWWIYREVGVFVLVLRLFWWNFATIFLVFSYFSRTINNYLWYPNAYTTISKRYVFFSNTGPIRVNPEGIGGERGSPLPPSSWMRHSLESDSNHRPSYCVPRASIWDSESITYPPSD